MCSGGFYFYFYFFSTAQGLGEGGAGGVINCVFDVGFNQRKRPAESHNSHRWPHHTREVAHIADFPVRSCSYRVDMHDSGITYVMNLKQGHIYIPRLHLHTSSAPAPTRTAEFI